MNRATPKIDPNVPLPLLVPRSVLSEQLKVGDIITLGSKEKPVRDQRCGFPVPHDQKFVVVAKEDE